MINADDKVSVFLYVSEVFCFAFCFLCNNTVRHFWEGDLSQSGVAK